MRVCFLTHYFPPEVGAPQTRIDLLARALATRGATVTVHTGFPHYPSGAIPTPYRNRPLTVEQRDGIKIVRSAVYPAANRGVVKRLADHASLAASALATAPGSGPADVVVAETPPLFLAAAGVGYAAIKRAAYVVNVADRWPQSAIELGVLRGVRLIAAAHALERFTYAHADLIAAPTQGLVDSLRAVPEAGVKVRRLWPVVDTGRFLHGPSPADGRGDLPLSLLYAGTLGMAQGLELLVRASKLAGPEVVQTTIAGDGADADRLRALVRDEAVPNVRMLGSVPASEVPGLYASADAAVVLLRDLEVFAGALPTKLLEAMAAGRPLLLSARGESAELVTRAGAGIVVAPGDPVALADAIGRLRAEPALRQALGRAGRAYAESHFGAGRAVDAWEELLSSVPRERGRARRSAPAAGDPRRTG